ncbi:DMT family transporter [Candidatus Roizmanbacteria bacterium]|nr:DMT family transporter [Candidatus Roizmanbacteria bacterium]
MNPILALIIANIIWGAAAPIFKFALTNIPPFTLAFLRFFIASLIMLPVLKNFKPRSLNTKDWLELILGSFFGITINIAFFFLALKKTQSINAPIIASSGPMFLYIMSVLFLKEKAEGKVFTGMTISLLGVLLIILSPILFDGKTFALGELQGNIFLVISTLGAVLHPLLYKNILKKVDTAVITCLGFIIGTIPFFPMMLGEFQKWDISMVGLPGIVGVLFGAILSSFAAYSLYNYGLSKIRAEEIGLFTYIDPVIAVLIAIPLLKEYPNAHFFLGSLLVFGGIFFAEGRIHWHPFHKL